jgi:hypothetical protein
MHARSLEEIRVDCRFERVRGVGEVADLSALRSPDGARMHQGAEGADQTSAAARTLQSTWKAHLT